MGALRLQEEAEGGREEGMGGCKDCRHHRSSALSILSNHPAAGAAASL